MSDQPEPAGKTHEELRAEFDARHAAHWEGVAVYEKLPPRTRLAIHEHIKSDLEREGWHHEDDCDDAVVFESDDQPEEQRIDYTVGTINAALTDWHDRAHGLTHFPSCTREPCALISPDLRNMPALHTTR